MASFGLAIVLLVFLQWDTFRFDPYKLSEPDSSTISDSHSLYTPPESQSQNDKPAPVAPVQSTSVQDTPPAILLPPVEDEKMKADDITATASSGPKVQTITYSSFPYPTMAQPTGLRKIEIGLAEDALVDSFPIKHKVAAITETRPVAGLVPLILHFASVLGPEWPILFFSTLETIDFYTKHHTVPAVFRRHLLSGRIKLIPIPPNVRFDWSIEVTAYLVNPWFWDQLGPAEHLLLFQADAIICSNSPRRVVDYFEYDFVGAPLPGVLGKGVNGGLSYRNVTLSRQVIRTFDWNVDRDGVWEALFEDQWFWLRMTQLGGRLPPQDVAQTFAVDAIWEPSPFGYHQIMTHNSARIPEIEAWCPEWRLTTNQQIMDHKSMVTAESEKR